MKEIRDKARELMKKIEKVRAVVLTGTRRADQVDESILFKP